MNSHVHLLWLVPIGAELVIGTFMLLKRNADSVRAAGLFFTVTGVLELVVVLFGKG